MNWLLSLCRSLHSETLFCFSESQQCPELSIAQEHGKTLSVWSLVARAVRVKNWALLPHSLFVAI